MHPSKPSFSYFSIFTQIDHVGPMFFERTEINENIVLCNVGACILVAELWCRSVFGAFYSDEDKERR